MRRLIFVVGALALVATGCGKSVEKGTSAQSGLDTRPACDKSSVSATANWGHKPAVTINNANCSAPKTLETATVVKGKGPVFKAGQTATIHYVGIAWSTKKEFDASWNHGKPGQPGKPFDVQIPGQLIQGWNESIPGMHVGERRILIIPPDKGYGPAGANGVIGPNETLVFVVDLVAAKDTPKAPKAPTPVISRGTAKPKPSPTKSK